MWDTLDARGKRSALHRDQNRDRGDQRVEYDSRPIPSVFDNAPFEVGSSQPVEDSGAFASSREQLEEVGTSRHGAPAHLAPCGPEFVGFTERIHRLHRCSHNE